MIENERHSGGVFAQNGGIENGTGSAIYLKNVVGVDTPTVIGTVWIEYASTRDAVVLDGSRNVTLRDSSIRAGIMSDPDFRVIRVKNGAINNVIQSNSILGNGVPLPASGLTTGDQIEIEAGCSNIHVQDNVTLRQVALGAPVHSEGRAHLVGQQNVISYADSKPTTGTWYKGDIVLNSSPEPSGHIGWVCIFTGTDLGWSWKPFGKIEA